jgi:hypothetical protein
VRDNHQLYLAIAHRAWGVAYRLAGEFADAEIRLRQALDMFTTLGARWQVGRTLVELGELEIGRRAPAVARDHFARAVDEFRALGAAPDMLRTQTALEELHGG